QAVGNLPRGAGREPLPAPDRVVALKGASTHVVHDEGALVPGEEVPEISLPLIRWGGSRRGHGQQYQADALEGRPEVDAQSPNTFEVTCSPVWGAPLVSRNQKSPHGTVP